MQRVNHLPRRVISIVLTIVMVASLFSGILPGLGVTAKAATNEIANDSLKISVGDLGQISTLNIVNNPRNRGIRKSTSSFRTTPVPRTVCSISGWAK